MGCQAISEIKPRNFNTSLPSLCFIYAGLLTVRSYFSHSLLLFDLSPFTSWSQPTEGESLGKHCSQIKNKDKRQASQHMSMLKQELKLAFLQRGSEVQPEKLVFFLTLESFVFFKKQCYTKGYLHAKEYIWFTMRFVNRRRYMPIHNTRSRH